MSRPGYGVGASLREAAQSLVRARLRTLLGIVGIAVGIASVIAMISSGDIATAEARRQFETLGTDMVTVQVRGSNTDPGIAFADALALAAAVPAIGEATPKLQPKGEVRFNNRRIDGMVQGVAESAMDLGRLALADGRFVSDLDVRRLWAVVGAGVAEQMRSHGAWEIVGADLDVGGHVFTVAGELRPAPGRHGMPVRLDPDDAVFIPVTTAKRIDPERDIKAVVARAAPGVHHETAVRDVAEWLRGRLGEVVRIRVTSARELIAQMESQLGLMTLLLGAVGSIALLVGGIGVMNIMLISVTERRREIGVRRALGASRTDIQRQFLVESVILTLAGGLAGLALGVGATWGICRYTGWAFFVSGASVLVGLGVSTAAGLFFGFHPAWRAARVDPIDALTD